MDNEKSLLLSIPEAAKLLNVKDNTIRVWICQGQVIPSAVLVRLGRRVLFNRAKFLDWIDRNCEPTMENFNE